MQRYNKYSGPDADDYAEVLTLNTAFVQATSELKGPQRGRLAAAPFLLFSVRENDLEWWDNVLAEHYQNDLTELTTRQSPELIRIQTAAIGFLWQLARRNPYVARVISGATVSWCERVAELPLLTLLSRVAGRDDLLLSRLETARTTGERLLGGGISSQAAVRRSSQLTALQALLTRTGLDEYSRLPAVACSMSVPMRVSDKKV